MQRRVLPLAIAQCLLGASAMAVTVDNPGDAGVGCTLRDAIVSVNNNVLEPGCSGSLDAVDFSPTAAPLIALTQGEIAIRESVAITGPGRDALTIQAAPGSRIFNIVNDTAVITATLTSVGLVGSDVGASVDGGIIFSSEALRLADCTLRGGSARAGGAIYGDGFGVDQALRIDRCVVESNSAREFGGAIGLRDAHVTLVATSLTDNQAGDFMPVPGGTYRSGGAIDALRGTLGLTNGQIEGNAVVYGYGGAIASSGEVAIRGTLFAGNAAFYGDGGHVWSSGAPLTIDQGAILRDGYAACGGGLAVYSPSATLDRAAIENNIGTAKGGGLVLSSATIGLGPCVGSSGGSKGLISGRHRGDRDAVVLGAASGSWSITRSRIADNRVGAATGPGGGVLLDSGTLMLDQSTLSGNTAGNGGALGITGGTAHAINSTVSGNYAYVLGGGVQIKGSGSRLDLTHVTAYGNLSAMPGATLDRQQGSVTLANSVLAAQSGTLCSSSVGITRSGNNWFSDASCGGGANGDPQLEPLAENGGPTRTHRPEEGSPLRDAADAMVCASALGAAVDQRGQPRPGEGDGSGDAICDIGAFEAQQVPVTLLKFGVD